MRRLATKVRFQVAAVSILLGFSSFAVASDYCNQLVREAIRSSGLSKKALIAFEGFLISGEKFQKTLPRNEINNGTSRRIRHPSEASDAVESLWVISDIEGNIHRLRVVYPESGSDLMQASLRRAVLGIPITLLQTFDDLIVYEGRIPNADYWAKHQPNFSEILGSADLRRTIHFYRSSYVDATFDKMLWVMRHEVGHAYAKAIFGGFSPSPDWSGHAERDSDAASEYAKFSWAEDFAETVRVYLESGAGALTNYWRLRLPNRFAVLDLYFGITPSQFPDSSDVYGHLGDYPQWRKYLEQVWSNMHYRVYGKHRPVLELTNEPAVQEAKKIIFFNKVTGTLISFE